MTKEDLLEYSSLCDEWDELCQRVSDLEKRQGVERSALGKMVYTHRLESLKKRKALINDLIDEWTLEIDRLPSLERRLIQLRYLEGWSWQKVADELGFSVDHVRGFLHKKALADLKGRNF